MIHHELNDVLNCVIAESVTDVIATGALSVGYDTSDDEPMVRFACGARSEEVCSPLLSLLNETVEFYAAQLNPEIDGDPVYFRFSRYMRDAVKHFIEEEASGRNPS